MINSKSIRGLGLTLMHATRLLRKHFDRRALRFDLTRAQWRSLKAIHAQQGLSQTELAERLEMEPIPVGRVIDRLEEAGYVERRADPADRRRWCLHLKDKAHGVIQDMEAIGDQLRGEAVAGVSEADFVVFQRVLRQIKDNLVELDNAALQEDSNT